MKTAIGNPEIGFSKRIMNIIDRDSISIDQILEENGKSTFGILITLISLPSALPIPAAGYSIPFGMVLIMLGFQMLLGKRVPWVPTKIRSKVISLKGKQSMKHKIAQFTSFFEKFIRHRLAFVFVGPLYNLYGLLVTLCGISLLIPIPLTNTIPAMGVFLIGIGMTERDGFFGIIGGLVALGGICLTTSILIFGSTAVELILQKFF